MEVKNIKINKKLLTIIISLLTFSLLLILFVHLIPSKENISPLNNIFSQIRECNNNFEDLINSTGIDTDKAVNTLSDEAEKLNSIKNSLNDLEVSANESNIKKELLKNLDYNVTLNNLCISLLKNPQPENLSSKYDDYLKNYNLLLNNYDSLTVLGIDLNFNDNAKVFFNYASKYFSTLISLSRDNDINSSLKRNYINNMKSCIESFDKIDDDLKPALDKIREENRDFTYFLKDIQNKKSILKEIKNQSYCITIPQNGTECYYLLKDTINYYDIYIISLEHSVEVEKNSNNEENKKNIEENYENSFSKFSDFKESLKNLRTELDKFNNK